jgi:3-hydroxypropanoate dehydrogenase
VDHSLLTTAIHEFMRLNTPLDDKGMAKLDSLAQTTLPQPGVIDWPTFMLRSAVTYAHVDAVKVLAETYGADLHHTTSSFKGASQGYVVNNLLHEALGCYRDRPDVDRSPAGKERLLPLMSAGNREKTAQAPWTVIIAHDLAFQEKIPKLFPHAPGAKDWFNSNRDETAFRNGALQGAYLMIAARAIGLDCGPMSGFDMAGVNREFFENGEGELKNWRANWICNLGFGDKTKLFDRSPRLEFDEACRIL